MPDYRYSCSTNDCGYVYIGSRLGVTPMCSCNRKAQVARYSVVVPLSEELQAPVSGKDSYRLRADLCQRWGITNKSHRPHGSNFSGNVTLAGLINDIVSPLSSSQRVEVRNRVIQDYGYDIDTQMMA